MHSGGASSPAVTAVHDSWLLKFAPRPQATVRLFCFPSAGSGAAMYRPWLELLPPQVELCAVQLPGRENRLREKPFASLAALVRAVLAALRPRMDRPFAFFGHSMGAMVAYELARALHAEGAPLPGHLMLSGRRAPQLPDPDPPMHALSDDALVAEIGRRYGGIPAEVLAHRDLLELLLPGLRADMTAVETHVFATGAPLPCPITVFGGDADRRAPTDQLAAWQAHAGAAFDLQVLRGGHFYLNDAPVRAELLGHVRAALATLPTEPSAR